MERANSINHGMVREKNCGMVFDRVDLIRAGWNDAELVMVQMARLAEDCGLQAVALHPRTREQGYAGKADWSRIAAVKAAATWWTSASVSNALDGKLIPRAASDSATGNEPRPVAA